MTPLEYLRNFTASSPMLPSGVPILQAFFNLILSLSETKRYNEWAATFKDQGTLLLHSGLQFYTAIMSKWPSEHTGSHLPDILEDHGILSGVSCLHTRAGMGKAEEGVWQTQWSWLRSGCHSCVSCTSHVPWVSLAYTAVCPILDPRLKFSSGDSCHERPKRKERNSGAKVRKEMGYSEELGNFSRFATESFRSKTPEGHGYDEGLEDSSRFSSVSTINNETLLQVSCFTLTVECFFTAGTELY